MQTRAAFQFIPTNRVMAQWAAGYTPNNPGTNPFRVGQPRAPLPPSHPQANRVVRPFAHT